MLNNETNPRAVILTAIPIEYQAVRAHLTGLRRVRYKGSIYERGTFIFDGGSLEVGIVETGKGNIKAALAAQRAIDYFKPALILLVGVAGGLKDVVLGDVVAATKVYGYESGKANTTFMMRPEVGNSAHDLVELAKAEGREENWIARITGALPEKTPKVFISPIAAGEKVVDSMMSEIYTFLKTHCSDAVAVEMEGGGFLQAVHLNYKIDALVIRGISDLIEGKSEADAKNSQDVAARHASAFAFEILANFEEVATVPNINAGPNDSRPNENIPSLDQSYIKIKEISNFFTNGRSIESDQCRFAIKLMKDLDSSLQRERSITASTNRARKKKLNDALERINTLSSTLLQLRQLCLSAQRNHNYDGVRSDAHHQLDLLINDLEQIMEVQ